jgi:hypothetical protein
MRKKSKELPVKTVAISTQAHKRASMACEITGHKLVRFLSEAVDDASKPILRKHGIDPETIEPVATAA